MHIGLVNYSLDFLEHVLLYASIRSHWRFFCRIRRFAVYHLPVSTLQPNDLWPVITLRHVISSVISCSFNSPDEAYPGTGSTS